MKAARFVVIARIAGVAAWLAGCSSYTLRVPERPPLDPFGPSPPKATRVCTVRKSVLGSAVTFPIRDNGYLVGASRGRGHFCWLAEPGHHEITIESDHVSSASLRAEPGKSYYLKQNVSNVLGVVTSEPSWIDYDEAQSTFADTPYEILSGVPGDEQLPEQPPFVRARPGARQGGF